MLRKHRGLMVALTAGTLIVTAAVAPASAAGPGAEPTFIKLINRTFDPLSGTAAAAARIDGSQVYLVQFRTALSDELRALLRLSAGSGRRAPRQNGRRACRRPPDRWWAAQTAPTCP